MHKGSDWLICLMIALISSFSAVATVYKWVDKDGKVHYSDVPRKGAEVVKPNPRTENTFKFVAPLMPKKQPKKETIGTEINVKITSPTDQQTIRDNRGNFTVTSSTSVPKHGLNYLLIMDGKPVAGPQRHGSFSLSNVDRGEHKLRVSLVDRDNKAIATSEVVTIYLHRFSKLFKHNSPAPITTQ
ncbi:DUF4124 domain-containing protein [Shewanella sp. OPT22]|nr:DUF4124 domain-containing protein [Shewanella sp. OPT22]